MSVSNVSLREGLARGNVSLPAVAAAKAAGVFERFFSAFARRRVEPAASPQAGQHQVETAALPPAELHPAESNVPQLPAEEYMAEATASQPWPAQYQAAAAAASQPSAEPYQVEAAAVQPQAEQYQAEAEASQASAEHGQIEATASQPWAEQYQAGAEASQASAEHYQIEATASQPWAEQYQAETAESKPSPEQYQVEAAASPAPAEQDQVEAVASQPPAWHPAETGPVPAELPLAAALPAADDPNRLVEEELQLFFGSRHHAFLPVWRKMTAQGRRIARDWSWSAFLLPGAWLMYRRMHFFGAVAIALPLAAMSLSLWLAGLVLLGVAAASGILGRSLYVSYAEQKIRALMVQAKTPEEYVAKLQAGGGVSLGGALAAAGMFAAGAGLMLLRTGAPGLA